MSAPPVVVTPEETLGVALALMSDNDIAFLPVLAGDKVVGAITRSEVISTYFLGRQRASTGGSPDVTG